MGKNVRNKKTHFNIVNKNKPMDKFTSLKNEYKTKQRLDERAYEILPIWIAS